MAEARQVGLVTQVERGLTADIYLVENKQNITRRKTLLTIAKRDFQLASNDLGFYYRGADGLPKILNRKQLPVAIPAGDPADTHYRAAFNDPDHIARLMATHPQLQWLERAKQRSEQALALAENSALPELDFSLGMMQPFGDVGLGGPSRDEAEAVVGFSFSVPLERRQARGDIAQAKAKLSGLSADQRRMQDQLNIELQNILQTLDAAQAVADLATLETTQLETLRAAEQRRFEQGASDFFVVNMREEALANAEVRLADALGQRQMALANLAAAAIDTERLYLAVRR
jgi:outer membrane protein TolC